MKKMGLPEYQEQASQPCVFIIDEINRGNISKIFGELITLIEDTKRKGEAEEMTAVLPYSHDEFSVPNNVYILGTMNTADRSIALMDTALRRRFSFVEMMPESEVLNALGVGTITDGTDELNVSAMFEIINKRIEYLYDREHMIGHAFFIKLKDDPSVETLAMIFKKNVIPLLQEYFYEDYAKIQYVLGDNQKENSLKFILDEPLEMREIFNGTPDIDLPEKTYRIQEEAFHNILSYKAIAKNL
jgi:5-methylcytosine-specific restriction protein B